MPACRFGNFQSHRLWYSLIGPLDQSAACWYGHGSGDADRQAPQPKRSCCTILEVITSQNGICQITLKQLLCSYPFRKYFTGNAYFTTKPRMKQILSVADQAGPLLQAARKSAGLSQTALARRLGISQSRLSAMELDPGSISLAQLLAMCSALRLELLVQTQGHSGDDRSETALTKPEW